MAWMCYLAWRRKSVSDKSLTNRPRIFPGFFISAINQPRFTRARYNPGAYRKPSLRVAVKGGDLSGRRLLCVTGSAFYRQIAMTYPTVSVNGVSVRVDHEGRYNLNDLHAAAVAEGKATESQRPSEFLKTKQVKRFVRALSDAKKIASVLTIKGGPLQGAWGLELIAIRYAAWLTHFSKLKCTKHFRCWYVVDSTPCPA